MTLVVAQLLIDDSSDKTITGTWEFNRDGYGRLKVPHGTSFPIDPQENEMFVRTDTNEMYYYDGYSWQNISSGSGDGYVEGPGSSTNNAVALFDGTTGTIIKNSVVLVDGSGNITGINILTASTINATTFDTNVAAAGLTLSGTTLAADGTDAHIDITLTPKGNAGVVLPNASSAPTVTTSKLYQTGGSLYFNTIKLAPGGSDGYVQYNNGGAFGGDAYFKWDDSNKYLILGPNAKITTGGETSPDVDPGGICLNHGAGTDSVLTTKSSSISHSFTTYAQSDTYFELRKHIQTDGGALLRGFSEATTSFEFRGYSMNTSTGSYSTIQLSAFTDDGGSGVALLSDNSNLVGIRNNQTVKFKFKGGGDAVFTGGLTLGSYVGSQSAGSIQWNSPNLQYHNGSSWVSVLSDVDLDGYVVGPSSATNHAVARFDGTTGKLIKNSSVTIDDSGNIVTSGTIDGVDISNHKSRHIDGGADEIKVEELATDGYSYYTPVSDGYGGLTMRPQLGARVIKCGTGEAFANIKSALVYAATLSPTFGSPVIIKLNAQTYVEDNISGPIELLDYVHIEGPGIQNGAMVTGQNNNGALFRSSPNGYGSINSVQIYGLSGVSGIGFLCDRGSMTALFNIAFIGCATAFRATNSGTTGVISTIQFIQCGVGCQVDSGAYFTIQSVVGVDVYNYGLIINGAVLEAASCKFSAAAIGSPIGVFLDNGGTLGAFTCSFTNFDKGFLTGINDAYASQISLRSTSIINSDGYDFHFTGDANVNALTSDFNHSKIRTESGVSVSREIFNRIGQTVTVGSTGADYTSIKDAIDSIADASIFKPYTVIVNAGIYVEDPIVLKQYVSLQAIGKGACLIMANNSTSTLMTMVASTEISGFTFRGPMLGTSILIDTGELNQAINDCQFQFNTKSIVCSGSGTTVFVRNCTFLETATSITSALRAESSGEIIAKSCDITAINGVDAYGGNIQISSSNFLNCDNAISSNNDGYVIFQGINVEDSIYGLTTGDIGENSIEGIGIFIREKTVPIVNTILQKQECCKFNISSGNFDLGKVSIQNWETVDLTFDSDIEGEKAQKIVRELHVGVPEKGHELRFGRGDDYVRGMIVYTTDSTATSTTDGGNLTNVTDEAKSVTGSTFGFQGTAANHTILLMSNLEDVNGNKLKHWGLNIRTVTAAIESTVKSFVFEVWDGTSWSEMETMSQQVENSYRYANEVFLRANNHEHISYGIDRDSTLATKTIDGYDGYWARIRITNNLTTAPTFQQFKLCPSGMGLNESGYQSFHGRARFKRSLSSAGNIFGESGGVSSGSTDVGSGSIPAFWAHEVKNSLLNGNGDAIYWQTTLSLGIDTSMGVFVEIIYVPYNSSISNADFILSCKPTEVQGVLVADPSGGIVPVERTLANTETKTASAAQYEEKTSVDVSDTTKVRKLSFGPFDISDYYEGDFLFFRFEADDLNGSDVFVLAAELKGVMSNLGERL